MLINIPSMYREKTISCIGDRLSMRYGGKKEKDISYDKGTKCAVKNTKDEVL